VLKHSRITLSRQVRYASRRLFGWALAATICLAAMGVSEAVGLKISGKIADESGSIVVGATVALTPVDGSGQPTGGTVARVKSSKKGKFTFGFSKPGAYVLSLEAEALQILTASVSMRDGDRKPVYGPDGVIEDRTAPVDPGNPVVAVGIPSDAFDVTIDLTVGQPQAADAGGSGAALEREIIGSGLGDEVEDVLAKLEARQYGPAVEEVDALIVENPELAPLHYLRGFALVKLDQIVEAEQALCEALRLDPEITGASGLLGQILGEQARYDEAVPLLRKELERADEPSSQAILLLALGQALIETGQAAEAVAALEEAQKLDPENRVTRVQLVDAYIRSGRDEAAEELMSAGLDAQAAAILHYNLAANLLRAESWEKGIEHLHQALALDSTLADAHKFLAQAYLALDNRAEAISEYQLYLEASPDAADADQTRRLIDALRQVIEGQ
jgi:tetratricopeptide (TPR) repeat protein